MVPQAAIGAKRCGYDWIGAERLLEKLHSWEVSTWENTFGKFPFEKKNFGKVPNIQIKGKDC